MTETNIPNEIKQFLSLEIIKNVDRGSFINEQLYKRIISEIEFLYQDKKEYDLFIRQYISERIILIKNLVEIKTTKSDVIILSIFIILLCILHYQIY